MKSSESATITVRVERIVAGGPGLARNDGRVLLVPMTAPGDLVELEVPGRGPHARLIRVIEPSPDRVLPECRHYGECGGCDMMHLSYEAQIVAKVGLVGDAMRRIGGQLELPDLTMIRNPKPFGSRTRATWRPTDSGTAGYLLRGSHDAIPIRHCPILEPALEAVRSQLHISGPTQGLTNGTETSIALEGDPAPTIEFTVVGHRLRTSADAFFQASLSLLDAFVGHVVEQATRGSPGHLLELYSGVGLFTLPVARRSGQVDAVEANSTAVEFARDNVMRAGLENVRLHQESAERWLAGRHSDRSPDAVLVDPPRVGLSSQVINRLVARAPDRLVYVSCDPASFARDARKLVDAGFHIAEWTAFDLFPQTHHVELVARFERTNH